MRSHPCKIELPKRFAPDPDGRGLLVGDALGSIAIGRVVQWPPAEVGRAMYEEKSRRLFGLIPWDTALFAQLD